MFGEFLRACLGWGLTITFGSVALIAVLAFIVGLFESPRGGGEDALALPIVGGVAVAIFVGGLVILFPPADSTKELFGRVAIQYAGNPFAIFIGAIPFLASLSLLGYGIYQGERNYKAGRGPR